MNETMPKCPKCNSNEYVTVSVYSNRGAYYCAAHHIIGETNNWFTPQTITVTPTEPKPLPAEPVGIDKTLAERGNRYGQFADNARITQAIMSAMVDSPNWNDLPDTIAEGLHMIAGKISRTLCGDYTYSDNFHDIAGYATCVEKFLTGEGS